MTCICIIEKYFQSYRVLHVQQQALELGSITKPCKYRKMDSLYPCIEAAI
jgi:hypothetical protein